MAVSESLSTMTAGTTPSSAGIRPFGGFEWMVARRYLSTNKKGVGVSLISIIAFAGIMLAVAILIIIMSVMQGFRAKLLEQLLGVNGHIYVEGQIDSRLTDYNALSAELAGLPGVLSARPVIQSPVYASGEFETAAVVYGMRPEDLRSIELIAGPGHLLEGSLDDFGEGRKGGNKVAIGIGLANKLGVRVGSPVNVVTAGGVETPMGTSPFRNKTYEVGAIFSMDNSEYDGVLMYMPLEQAQVFFRQPNSVDRIEVRVERPDEVLAYQSQIEDFVGSGAIVFNWRNAHGSYVRALDIERGMMRIILSLIIVIASMNIISSLVMLVKDKTSDIAVMRTFGATRASIMTIFCLSGTLIGLLGAVIGAVLGIIVSLNIAGIEKFLSDVLGVRLFNSEIYLFSEMPAQIPVLDVLFIPVFAVVMSFVATLYPAWRAAKLDPVEALRYE